MNKKEEHNDVKYNIVPQAEERDLFINNGKVAKEKKDTTHLIFSAITACQLILVGGGYIIWTSPALVVLQKNNTDNNPIGRSISLIETSIITGIPVFVSTLATLLIPALADLLGRKIALYMMGFGMLASIVALGLSTNIIFLIVSLILVNVFFNGAFCILPIYFTEICEDHNRAKYGCILSLFLPSGQLLFYILGELFSLKIFTLLTAVPVAYFAIAFIFAPETPVYYLKKERTEDCIKVLKKLRNKTKQFELDLDMNKIQKSLSSSENKEKAGFLTVFRNKEGRVGIMLASLLMCADYFSGVPTVMMMMGPIFDDAGLSISGNLVAIIVGIFKVIGYGILSSIIEKTGRKPMLVISCTGSCISVALLGLYFYLKSLNWQMIYYIQWISVLSVIVYVIFYSFGMGPLPMGMIGELFPTDTRASAIAFVITFVNLSYSIFVFLYPIIRENMGTHWCLWIFGIFCGTIGILIYRLLPETSGKSVHEIQDILRQM